MNPSSDKTEAQKSNPENLKESNTHYSDDHHDMYVCVEKYTQTHI